VQCFQDRNLYQPWENLDLILLFMNEAVRNKVVQSWRRSKWPSVGHHVISRVILYAAEAFVLVLGWMD
jgi:hypothetical protein